MVGPASHLYLSQPSAKGQPASLHPGRKERHLPLVTSCTYYQKYSLFSPFSFLLGFPSRSCHFSAHEAML